MKPEDKAWFNMQIKQLLGKQYSQPMTPQENMGEEDFLKMAPNAQESYIAFKPSQIKSAIGTKIK